jgi:heme/copper-type cytochrome/quinol oxidase subunit 2
VELELFPLLSTIILVATIVTIVFAFFSYAAYRAREKKGTVRPERAQQAGASVKTPMFRRYEINR